MLQVLNKLVSFIGHCYSATGKNEAFPVVLGNRGTRAFISGEEVSKNEGNIGNIGKHGTQGIQILILGSYGIKRFISGEQGNRYTPAPPPALGGPQECHISKIP